MVSLVLGILIVLILAGSIGFGVHSAARALEVRPRRGVPSILNELPGTDCGACGFPRCEDYAEAVNAGEAEPTSCAPGGGAVRAAIERVLERRKRTAPRDRVYQVHCRGGGAETSRVFEYRGMVDCNAVFALYEGNLACKEACLGLGSCIRACPYGAIGHDHAGKVWVDAQRCIGCGECASVCPTGVLRPVPVDTDVVVACNNHDVESRVREICSVGCIACRLCERRSPGGGFAVTDNLATIDYRAGGNRLRAARACPTRCIVPMSGLPLELQTETVVHANEED